MKKILFGLMALSALTACDGDYTDYAAPQKYGQDDPVSIQIAFNPTNVAIDMTNDAGKDVALFTYTASNEEISSITAKVIRVDEGGEQYNDTIDGYGKDGKLYVAANEIERIIGARFGSHNANLTYTFAYKADIVAHTGSGDGAFFEATTSVPLKFAFIPEYSDGYKAIVNGVEAGTFKKQSDGIYKVSISTTEKNSSILLYAVNGTNEEVMGSYIEDNNATSGGVALANNAKTINIAEPGNWVINLDIKAGTYSIEEDVPTEFYMTGSELDWGGTWLPLILVNSNWDGSGKSKGVFWILRYFSAGEMFKFAPKAEWKGDFGGNQMKVEDKAEAGYTNDGSNCKIEKAGWYTLTLRPMEKSLVIGKPQVYICGETVKGGWEASNPAEANIFTVPADKDGEFVSPAFVNSGNVRMFTLVDGIDWWRTEYNVYDGKIVIRTEGDQPGVWSEAGKKVYLNFSTMTGEIK